MQRLMQQLSTLISRRIKMKRLKRSLARKHYGCATAARSTRATT